MCVSSYTYTQTHTQFVSSFHYFCMSWNFQTIIKFRKSSFKQHRIHPIHSSSSITNLPINSLYQKTVINNLCSLANFISHYVIWLARILAARTIKWTPVVEDRSQGLKQSGKKATPKRSHTVRFYLYNILDITKLQRWRTD